MGIYSNLNTVSKNLKYISFCAADICPRHIQQTAENMF